jgi:hypothetical protein
MIFLRLEILLLSQLGGLEIIKELNIGLQLRIKELMQHSICLVKWFHMEMFHSFGQIIMEREWLM